MRAKEYLMQALTAKRELEVLLEQRRALQELATSCGSGFGGSEIKPSGNSSKVESAAVKLADLSRDIDGRVQAYVDIIRDASARIEKLSKPRYRQVLTLRYVIGMPWSEVSGIMGYTEPKSVYKIHGWALRELQKYL